MDQPFCEWVAAWSCIAITFLAIGVPTFTCGCDTYYPSCLTYMPITQTVRNVTLRTVNIPICQTIGGVLICNSFPDSYAQVVFDACIFKTTEVTARSFPIGSIVSLLKNKQETGVCELPGGLPRNLGITGIVFTSLATICILVVCIGFVYETCRRRSQQLPK
jgi:hypothetical protein